MDRHTTPRALPTAPTVVSGYGSRPTALPRTAYIANAKFINTSPYLGTNSSNMIRIEAISSFRQLGPRNNQEDWLMPETPSSTDRVLVLCDGMGGHGHGEVASQTVAEAVYQ